MNPRHSKIVCTIGPATRSPRMIHKLLLAGMDVARLNFSHGTHAEHAQSFAMLREAAAAFEKPIAILADLQGPKIRTGVLAGGGTVTLRAGQQFVITTAKILGDSTRVSTIFRPLPREVKSGDRILLSDGLIELRVERIRKQEVICQVVNGGALGEHQGINLPGVKLRVPALTQKDRKDLRFALAHGADYIAVSFVRRPEDVLLAKSLIRRAKKDTPVIAKLEKPEAIENLEAILRASEGVMVARGDLGVEMRPERVPVVQKNIIARAREFRRPVIIATQMLESMTENPRPTRAEASDVANAIFDGSDAVMLSAETATGRYPREAVAMMARIVVEAEGNMGDFTQPRRRRDHRGLSVAETICESIAHSAEDLPMGAIAVFTETGNTARMLSKYRPKAPIYAFTHMTPVVHRLNLYWGVHPVFCRQARSAEQMVTMAEQDLVRRGLLKPGDVLGVVAGTRQASGSTNLMRLHVVTDEEANRIVHPKKTAAPRRKNPGKH